MACDMQTVQNETIAERKAAVKAAVEALDKRLLKRQARVVVGPQGAITFTGWPEGQQNRITDACAYRRIMATGSAIAKAEIARAEQMAGRTVDRRAVNSGTHSHDGGGSWNGKH